jgi:hypothetical protein
LKRNFEIERAHREDLDRREIESERESMLAKGKDELDKELRKLKEILTQEFEFR